MPMDEVILRELDSATGDPTKRELALAVTCAREVGVFRVAGVRRLPQPGISACSCHPS